MKLMQGRLQYMSTDTIKDSRDSFRRKRGMYHFLAPTHPPKVLYYYPPLINKVMN